MKVLKEFREFALRGNVMDLAVGIIIGTAFGAVVKGLVDEIIMPAVGVLLGGVDFGNRYFVIKGGPVADNATLAQARETGASVIGYGQFLNLVITFVIVAFAVFMLIKGMNSLRRKQQQAPAPESPNRPCPECLTAVPKAAKRCSACASVLTPA